MLPPQAEKKECPGEVAGCGAMFGALDLNHAIWQSMASQLSQNGSSRTTQDDVLLSPGGPSQADQRGAALGALRAEPARFLNSRPRLLRPIEPCLAARLDATVAIQQPQSSRDSRPATNAVFS